MKNTLQFLLAFYCVIYSFTAKAQTSPYRQWIRAETPIHDKLALVIGNSAYANNRLPGARTDADLMAKTLESQGYDVMLDADLDQSEMIYLITDFSAKTPSYKSYLVYYAGHAFEINGVNYLVPLEVDLSDPEVAGNCISLDEDILSRIADPAKPKLIILDACRTTFRDLTLTEIEQVRRRKNTKIIYSTVSRTRVKDDNPFAEEFTKAVNRGGCIDDILLRTTQAVDKIDPNQVINSEGSLLDNLCFSVLTTPDGLTTPDDFLLIPGDTFQMGDQFGEGYDNEKPVHTVKVNAFYLQQTEVTFEEYDKFCEATLRPKPYDEKWGREKQPAIHVSWCDAVAYANWLSTINGLQTVYNGNCDSIRANWAANGYRLPTEAEWEYAARQGGQKVRFGNGENIADPSKLNFTCSTEYIKGHEKYAVAGDSLGRTLPVASLVANSLGLYDMSGNVWEWCWDWYDENYYNYSPSDNPRGPSTGTKRIRRGGSWDNGPSGERCTYRDHSPFRSEFHSVGFRLARNAQ